MGKTVERRQEATEGLPEIELRALSGLSLKLDKPYQPNNVWKQLQNCDLYIPGSIRKVRPSTAYGATLSGQSYLNFVNYWAQPNKANGPINRVLAVTSNAQIVDMNTGTVYLDFSAFVPTPITTIPYMEVFPLYFNPFNVVTWAPSLSVNTQNCVMKYGTYDGRFYVYSPNVSGTTGGVEPLWEPPGVTAPTDGGVTWINQGEVNSERFQENALVWIIPGLPMFFFVEYQFSPNNASETPSYWFRYVGIAQPKVPIEVVPITISPNLDGYSPVAGRGFVYTLYDPHTFHESSPSPFAGPTQINDVSSGTSNKHTIRGSLLPPLPTGTGNAPFRSYQEYYLAVPQYIVQQAQNSGYTAVFFYATKDGGATFYRIPTLLDQNGNVISNSDGSVPTATLLAGSFTDVFPIPTSMITQASCRVYEGSGPINLAPDPANLGPQSWTQANADLITVVPGDGQQPTNSGDSNTIYAAAEIIGNGPAGTNPPSPLHKATLRSNKIPVTIGQPYVFQAFIDATEVTGGIVRWDVINGDFSNKNSPYLTLTEPNGSSGFQSGTFTPTHNNIRLRVFEQGLTTGNQGDIVSWSTPMLYTGTTVPTTPTNYPTPDDALVTPAPAALSQQPPPQVPIQMVQFAGSIFVIEEGTFRIWYSNTGDFQSWGANAYLPLDESAGVPVLELKNVYDRLIVGKQASISDVQGAAAQFGETVIDPNHGVQSVRSSIGFGSSFITLTGTGLTMFALGTKLQQIELSVSSVSTGYRPEHVIGDPIKPYTDHIITAGLRSLAINTPCPGIDTNRNFYLFTFQYLVPGTSIVLVKLVLANMAHEGPSSWSELVPALPVQSGGSSAQSINSMKEIIDPTSGQLLFIATGSGQFNLPQGAYALFNGVQDGTLTAIAETWPLPDLQQLPNQFRDTIKIFHELWVEGEDITNWTYQWSTDLGVTYSAAQPLRVRNKIGVNGRQISFIFTHAVPAASPTLDPMLSYMKITYSERRQASGQNGY